ncbi:A disintegrin and metalloproteinase with thrombospondin motifs 15 [Saguinus oedipus]|uniref:A disintegrin and metalloproteinase with thrombospondin motifs 15 n=1 Tax=Saguinus oedipus TaxID=9490 RepID=A0ABQ9URT1_SAGOE|nr:A disintegrin and metalloproteinase with thrombospondin motifs 15 [Saguinus oedipus]
MLLLGILTLAFAGRTAGGSQPQREVVVPIRLDPDINGRRYYWRGPEDSRDQGLIFQITAFQEDFYLHLTPDAQFLAPAFATEHLGVPLQGFTGGSSDLRRCFYSGDVNSEPDSFAAVSLCGGLRGAFGYRGAEYVISPLPNASASAAQRNSQGAHLLQRRSVPGGTSGDPTSRCGVASGWNPAILRALDPYKPPRAGLGESRSRRRSGRAKRFVSIPRYVETLVVADESMVKFHGADLEHYLLTLLGTAARLYRHPSILNPINIVVVKVLLLRDRDSGPKVTGNAALTLRNFCAWQKKLNKVSDKHAEYWDTAILFTRQVS